jgi:hypothetical protein
MTEKRRPPSQPKLRPAPNGGLAIPNRANVPWTLKLRNQVTIGDDSSCFAIDLVFCFL